MKGKKLSVRKIGSGVRSAWAKIHFLEFTSWIALGNSPKPFKHLFSLLQVAIVAVHN